MKKLLAILIIVLATSPLYARGKLQGYVQQGGQKVQTNGVGSSSYFMRSYPSSTVTVYNTGTLTTATIYSDSVGTVKSNPFSADSSGFWSFYAEDGDYDVQFTGSATYTLSALRVISNVTNADVRSFGAKCNGSTDDKIAFQAAANALPTTGGQISVPASLTPCVISGAVTFPYPTRIEGAAQSASTISSTADPSTCGSTCYMFDFLAGGSVHHLTFTKTASATNTQYKAINLDFGRTGGVPIAGTRMTVRDVTFTNWDIPIYMDGKDGSATTCLAENLSFAINPLGTGGATSVRPTIAMHNCGNASILHNRHDASISTQAVNNIYMFGDDTINVEDNDIKNGIGVKVLSTPTRPIDKLTVAHNRFSNTFQSISVFADGQPVRHIDIDGNETANNTNNSGFGDYYFGYGGHDVVGDAFPSIVIRAAFFRNIQYSCIQFDQNGTQAFNSVTLIGNHYYNWGIASASNAVITGGQFAGGVYRNLTMIGEIADGNSVGRAYKNANLFNIEQVDSLTEVNVTTPASSNQTSNAVSVFNTANETATTGVFLTLTFDSERYDYGNLHSTVSNTSRLTAPIAGLYRIGGSISWTANATGERYVQLRVNGVTQIAVVDVPTCPTLTCVLSVTRTYLLAAGDYVELRAFQNSGGNLDVRVDANYSPEFWMERVK